MEILNIEVNIVEPVKFENILNEDCWNNVVKYLSVPDVISFSAVSTGARAVVFHDVQTNKRIQFKISPFLDYRRLDGTTQLLRICKLPCRNVKIANVFDKI